MVCTNQCCDTSCADLHCSQGVLCCAVSCCPVQVRKPKRPARLAALPDLTTAAAAGFGSSTAERLNASYHPNLQWPEFGYLLDKLAAASSKGGRRGRAAAGVEGGVGSVLLRGAGGPVPAAVLDWGDAAAADAADKVLMEQEQQQDNDLAGGGWQMGERHVVLRGASLCPAVLHAVAQCVGSAVLCCNVHACDVTWLCPEEPRHIVPCCAVLCCAASAQVTGVQGVMVTKTTSALMLLLPLLLLLVMLLVCPLGLLLHLVVGRMDCLPGWVEVTRDSLSHKAMRSCAGWC